MKRVQGIIYEAFDGKKFVTEYDCALYETERKLIKKGLDIKCRYDEVIKDIKFYCGQMLDEEFSSATDANVCVNTECPFFKDYVEHQNCLFNCLPHYDF